MRRFKKAMVYAIRTGAVVGAGAGMLAGPMACGRKDQQAGNPTNQPSAPGALSVATQAADTDVAAKGTTLPAGYVAQLDNSAASIQDASYAADGSGRWEVKTGPAHILYRPQDTTSKTYDVTATFEQLEAPKHPEAFGVFIGGKSLDDPAKRQYTYFLVRGTGEYLVKIRNGTDIRTLTDWTPHPAIPKQSASGKAVYGIRIDVANGVAKVSVNGQPVTMISGPRIPVVGVAGLRINHNLHLMVTPALVTNAR